MVNVFCKDWLEAQDGYQPDIGMANLIGEVAVRFEANSGADAKWLVWGRRLLPNLAQETARYQEQATRDMAATAERNRLEHARRDEELLNRFITGELTQEQYSAAIGVASPRFDVEMVDETGDEEAKEVEEIAGRAERERTVEMLGEVESKSTTGRKKEKGKDRATGKSTEKSSDKGRDQTKEKWWSDDLTVVRKVRCALMPSRRADLFDRILLVVSAALRIMRNPSSVIKGWVRKSAPSASSVSKAVRKFPALPVGR